MSGWGEGKFDLVSDAALSLTLQGWISRRFDAEGRMPEANIAATRRWPDRAAGRIARRSPGQPAITQDPPQGGFCVWPTAASGNAALDQHVAV